MNFILSAILLFCTDKALEPAKAEASQGDLLDRALRAIKMSRQDVTLDPEYRRRDSFALKSVDELMRSPLKLPDYGQQLGEEMARITTLRGAVEKAAARLEITLDSLPSYPASPAPAPPPATAAKPGEDPAAAKRKKESSPASPAAGKAARGWKRQALRKLPQEVAEQVCALVDAAEKANRTFSEAYDLLNEAERKVLLEEKDKGHRSSYPLHEYFLRHHRGEENSEEANKSLFAAAQRFRLDRAFAAAAEWAEAVEKAKGNLRAWLLNQRQVPVPENPILDVQTPAGRLVVGGGGPDVYSSPAALLIELGGDDTYLAPVAGGSGCTAAIDLAGSDRYHPMGDGALGVGKHGVGIFIDCEGNDHYRTADVSLGVGLFGVGIALDENGDDEYDAQEISCGVAALGIGILIDQNGNDTYHVRRMGQAAAVTRGFGLLLDRAGNDAYFAGRRYPGWSSTQDFFVSAAQGFAGGIREYTSGGIALLLDLAGHDAYWGEAIAQGVGYWFATGLLIDAAGNDFYYARHYSQGSAFHFAVSALLDNSGNDSYIGGVTCQGSGYDYSAGTLLDYEGDDLYRSDHLSSGSGGVTGMGFLFDQGGSDQYFTGRGGSLSLGGGQFQERRGFGCIGVFIDSAGQDQYAYSPCANNALWTRPQDGAGLDTENAPALFTRRMAVPAPPVPEASKPIPPAGKRPLAPEEEVRAAIHIMANWKTTPEQRAEAAESLKKHFAVAEPMLIHHLLAEPFYLSFQAAYEAIPKVGEPMVPSLIRVYESGDAEARVRALNMLGSMNDPRSIEVLAGALGDESYLVRGTAAQSLAKRQHKDALPRILGLLQDPHHTCRAWAALALEKLKEPSTAPVLAEALSDPHYSVRTIAARGLAALGKDAVEPLRAALKSPDGLVRCRALETLVSAIQAEAQPDLLQGLDDPDWLVRAAACRAAAALKLSPASEAIKKLVQTDPDSYVRRVAGEASSALIP